MLNLKATAVLFKIVRKLDIKPLFDALSDLDIFTEAKSAKDALAQLTPDKLAVLGVRVFEALQPQLDVIADFLAPLAAAYKGVSIEDAENMDVFEVGKEIVNDEGIRAFFFGALRRKVEQKH